MWQHQKIIEKKDKIDNCKLQSWLRKNPLSLSLSSSLQARDEIHRNTDEIERIYNKVRLGQIRLD